MFKKAVYALKKSTKIIGLVLAVYYLYSFYDPSFLSDLRARNGLLGLIFCYRKIQEIYLRIGDKSSSFYYRCLVDFYYFKNNSKTTLFRVVLGFAALVTENP